jgi:hypothetical protein
MKDDKLNVKPDMVTAWVKVVAQHEAGLLVRWGPSPDCPRARGS